MYNTKFGNSRMSSQTPFVSLGNTLGFPADSSIDPESLAKRSDFKVRNSSTGGKIPIHGPRRMVYPS
jgi:lipoate-protein ligase B